MTTELATRPLPDIAAIEQVLIKGDLSGLNESQRLAHYRNVCNSLGLNPLTQPFDYLKLNGKLVLYAKRDAAEQLRKLNGVSITAIQTQHFEGVYIVTASAQDKTGRTDVSTGVVPLGSLKGEALANALMKAETKAKRRVTLSICGLGMLDETEVDSIPGAKPTYTVEAPGKVAESEDARATGRPVVPELDPSSDDRGGSSPSLATPDRIDGSTYIDKMEVRDTKNPNIKKHLIILSDGREVSTINPNLAAVAEQCCQERAAVQVETKATKWGEDLLTLQRADIQIDHSAPVDAKDLPF